MGKDTYSKFELRTEAKRELQDAVIEYFESERDEQIGLIASEEILDFFIELVGDAIYNKALDDAKRMHQRAMENLESDYYSLYQKNVY